MTTTERGARRSVLACVAAGLVGVAFVALLAVAVVRTVRPPESAGSTATRVEASGAGQEVRAVIGTGGKVEVTHRVHSASAVSSLHVSVDLAAARPDLPTLEDVVVSTDGIPVARLRTVDTVGSEVPLSWPVHDFAVSYRVAPAPGDAESVEGRALTFVPTLRVEYAGAVWPLHRSVVAEEQDILNVACLEPGAGVRPCGSATADGWTADLAAPDGDDGLLVQVQQRDPSPAHAAGGDLAP